MHPVPADTLIANLNWRYATKLFDASKRIPAATWSALEQSLILSPSSFGLQLWKFVDVQDKALRTALRGHSWNQPQVTDASHLIVLCRKISATVADADRLIDSMSAQRGVPRAALQGYRDMMAGYLQNPPPGFDVESWTARQVYIAAGFFMATAANLGVDACPMEGFDARKYDELLGLAGSGFASTVVIAAGYRSENDDLGKAKKVRYPAGELIIRK